MLDEDLLDQDEVKLITPPATRKSLPSVPGFNVPYERFIEILKEIPGCNRLAFSNDSHIDLNFKDLKEIEFIRESQYEVKKYIHNQTNQILAVKSLTIHQSKFKYDDKKYQMIKIWRELVIHSHIESDYIVRFYGFCIENGYLRICMEFMDESLYDLYHQLHREANFFPEQLLGYVAVAVINGIRDMLKFNVIHRDIKPENILVNDQGEIKLCDFSESRVIGQKNTENEDQHVTNFHGTLRYLPPERFTIKGYGKHDECSDVWSFGITLIELILGYHPFKNDNFILLQNIIKESSAEKIFELCFNKGIINLYNYLAFRFLKLCLSKLESRPKFTCLRKEEFYKKYSPINKDEVKSVIYGSESSSLNNPVGNQGIIHVTKFCLVDYIESFAVLILTEDGIRDVMNRQRSRSCCFKRFENTLLTN